MGDVSRLRASVGETWSIPSDVGETAHAEVVLTTLRGTVVFRFVDGPRKGGYAYAESDEADSWTHCRRLDDEKERAG